MTPPQAAQYPSRRYAYYVIGVLILVTLLSLLDRMIPTMLVGPLRRDLGLTDSQFSVIQGLAFAIFYCLAGFPFGRLVDRRNRRNLIIFGCALWGAMTLLCGFAENFWQLFIARAGVGVGEACLAPAAYSLIADYVEPKIRGRALAVYFTGLTLGTGASFLLGGLILRGLGGVTHLELPLLGHVAEWQVVFFIAGSPALLMMALMLTVREVPRKETLLIQTSDQPTLREFFRYVALRAPTFTLLYLSYVMLAFVSFCVVPWAPTFYLRQFGVPVAASALAIGLTILVGGVVGTLASGICSDRWAASGKLGGRARVPWMALVCCLPAVVLCPLIPDLQLSYVLLGLIVATTGFGLASVAVTVTDIVPNRMRGQAIAVYQIVATLSNSLAPTVVALVTERVFRDEMKLGVSLVVAPAPLVLAGILFSWFGLRQYNQTRAALQSQRI